MNKIIITLCFVAVACSTTPKTKQMIKTTPVANNMSVPKKEIIAILKANRSLIKGLKDLNKQQLDEIIKFVKQGLVSELYYEDKLFYCTVEGDIYLYDLDDKNKVFTDKFAKVKLKQKSTHSFEKGMKTRPYEYLSNIIKLGGMSFYSSKNQEADGDAMFVYEFFSFDKVTGIFGVSMNATIGIKHVGGSFAYQFIYSKWFKNTNLLAGYAYNWFNNESTPYLGLALNF